MEVPAFAGMTGKNRCEAFAGMTVPALLASLCLDMLVSALVPAYTVIIGIDADLPLV
jgi:hypothetical protein